MQFTIPANTPAATYGELFQPFCDWLKVNGVDPAFIDGSQLLTVTDALISGAMRGFGPFQVDVKFPMPTNLAEQMTRLFFTDTSTTDNEAAPMDDMAHLYQQLATARAAQAEAKRSAEEARDQILARLRGAGKEYGAIGGQRVVFAKTITKHVFATTRFAADNPELAAKYTEERPETRLEIL